MNINKGNSWGDSIMLKCGQKDNKNYTFGLRKDQMKKEADMKSISRACCSKCGVCVPGNASFCPNCGAKL